jgi:hypothetical protein
MKLKLATLITLVAIAGCTTMTPEERRAADEAQCRDYGFKPRTDAFAECLQRIQLDRHAQQRANMASFERTQPVVIYQPIIVRDK